jgi:hypothetical protein
LPPKQLDEKTRLAAREYFLRARVYRILALVFAATGVLVFICLYMNNVGGGSLFDALRRPSTVLIVLLPFLPAYLFSRLSAGAEKKLAEILAASDKK